MFFLMMFFSVFIYSGIIRSLGWNVIMVPFGITKLSLSGIVIGTSVSFIFLLLAAGVANWAAVKLFNGRGTFSEVLGMFGYSMVINPLRAAASVVFMLIIFGRISGFIRVSVTGAMASGLEILSSILPLIFGVILILSIWTIWIRARAISASHEISLGRGILCSLLSFFILTVISTMLTSISPYVISVI